MTLSYVDFSKISVATEMIFLKPFTNDFPRADVHELITPDLLHQVIKGTFKDHLVTWLGEYLVLAHGEKHSLALLDIMDKRYLNSFFFLFWDLNQSG